jgi:DNA-binding protein WhiA
MSFSSEVKEELSRQISTRRHCQLAEIAAILAFCGRLELFLHERCLTIYTENITLARKFYTLLMQTFQIHGQITVRQNVFLHKGRTCMISIKGKKDAKRVLQAIKWQDSQGEELFSRDLVNGILIKNACCKRAFIRGAFLASGSISDPEKSYHFEIVCEDKEKAAQMRDVINSFSLGAKIVSRKKSFVVYLKEGAQIVDILNIMEAHVALMNLENVRIIKEMRGSVNRQVNCETANIGKTVSAAVKQLEDIKYIQKTAGLHSLSDGLREIAEIRLRYPEAPLKELGTFLSSPVGKSGVNHRLRKISKIAQEQREKNADN